MPTRMERRQERARRRRREARAWLLELAAVLVLSVLVRTFVFSLTTVQGPSMRETLHSGQVVAVDKLYAAIGDFSRGAIVICRFPDSRDYYVKRIVGLPGETIEIREGTVYIDGEPIAETYLTRVDDQSMDPITLAKDEIFVMGDNRPVSRDSRAVGPLTLDEIYGRVLFVAFPFNEIRSTMALPEY